MGQLAEAVADAELALSLDPSNKEIETQLKGLRTDLRDANTAKSLQQQLQQPATAEPSENLSPQDLLHPETIMQSLDAKSSITSASLLPSVSLATPSKPEATAAKQSTAPVSANSAPATALEEKPVSIDPRLISANALLQVGSHALHGPVTYMTLLRV
jgi:hypothetical protein